MKQSYKLRTRYNIDNVLEMAECHKSDSKYETYKVMLEELIAKHIEDVKPMGYWMSSNVEGNEALFCMASIGGEIDHIIKSYFDNYQYLEGMMMNAFGDEVLFQATNHLYEYLKDEVSSTSKFLTNRYEPGTSKVSMSMQKEIYDLIVPAFDLDLKITEGFMLSPSKTVAYYYLITNEDCSRGLDHDCSACDSLKCKQRRYVLTVHKGDTSEIIQAKRSDTILDAIRQHQIYVEAPCNGMGKCGKCKVKLPNHDYALTQKEKDVFSLEEMEAGYILSCLHPIEKDLTIYLDAQASHLEIESDYKAFNVKTAKYDAETYIKENYPIGIGVDIGTTTVAVTLINLVTHETIGIKKRINPQKAYGSDIISRIMYVGEHDDQQLGQIIIEAIEDMSLELISESGYNWHHIEEMVISGNTTMIYLLMGLDPQALAVAPFTTVEMGQKTCDSKDIFSKVDSFKVTIMPWISAYVGGDIVSGLYANHIIDTDENVMFVDIGTNGEMVLKTKDFFIGAATAAGPAFEGANIKCGMGSISGAICEISADGDGYDIETLGDADPEGICGSALIDAVALMIKQGHVDAMGYMEKEVMLHGDIGIYPADIRQVQLAKAAIYAGVEVLLDVAGITLDDIDVFYIAGGFGSHLNVENSAFIGLIPSEVVDKVEVVGNASLAGSVRYLLEKDGKDEVEALRSSVAYEELSMSMKFNECYVEAMMFGNKK